MEFTEIDQADSSKAEIGEVNGNAVNSDSGMRFKLNKHGKCLHVYSQVARKVLWPVHTER